MIPVFGIQIIAVNLLTTKLLTSIEGLSKSN